MSPLPPTRLGTLPSRQTLVLWLLGVTACWDDVEPLSSTCPSSLLEGDLVLTEVMPDPEGSESDSMEWIELYNASSRPIQLEGLLLERSRPDGSGVQGGPLAAATIDPWTYVVLGEGLGDHDRVQHGYGQLLGSLSNGSGRIALGCAGLLLDEILYEDPIEGSSVSLDGALAPDALLNDDPATWCPSRSSYVAAPDVLEHGTPGAPNDLCPGTGPSTCEDDGHPRPVVPARRGDVVITEFLADPSGPDEGREWVELEIRRELDLNGLWIGSAPDDRSTHVLPRHCVRVEAGTRIVLAASLDTQLNGELPRADHRLGWTLANTGPRTIVVGWGDEVLDEVTYVDVAQGRASALDPNSSTPELNDDPAAFCPASRPWADGDLGTPGAPNPPCPVPLDPGSCRTPTGEVRAVEPPGPGEVRITELMADPQAVPDSQGEWIEIRATGDVDLNGLVLSKDGAERRLESSSCLRVEAGSLALLGRDAEPDHNGGLPPLTASFDLALDNFDGVLRLATDDTTLDEVRWERAPPGRSLLRAAPESIEDGGWCHATTVYGMGDRGTPGREDPPCDPSVRWCLSDDGPRPERAPVAGDLVLTEYLADPAATPDDTGEWVEFVALESFDLSALAVSRDGSDPIPIGVDVEGPYRRCTAVEPGEFIVLGRSTDPADNGGVDVRGLLSVALPNSGGTLSLFGSEALVDQVPLASFGAGIATGLSPEATDAQANDELEAYCPAMTEFGHGDSGTPERENPPCPD